MMENIEVRGNADPLTPREESLIAVHLYTLSEMNGGAKYKAIVSMESINFSLIQSLATIQSSDETQEEGK